MTDPSQYLQMGGTTPYSIIANQKPDNINKVSLSKHDTQPLKLKLKLNISMRGNFWR